MIQMLTNKMLALDPKKQVTILYVFNIFAFYEEQFYEPIQ